MVGHKLAIVIPALNEETSIGGLVSRLKNYGVPIVIDDGSTDKTGILAFKAGAILVRHEINKGYDEAINSGFVRARELGLEMVLTMDADGQHDDSMILKFAEEVANGSVVVTGVRNNMPRIGERIFAYFSKKIWGIQDPLCGFKAYSMDFYKRVGAFDSYGSIGTQLVIFAARNNLKIAQIPIIVWPRNNGGTARFGGLLKANFLILRALLLALTLK